MRTVSPASVPSFLWSTGRAAFKSQVSFLSLLPLISSAARSSPELTAAASAPRTARMASETLAFFSFARAASRASRSPRLPSTSTASCRTAAFLEFRRFLQSPVHSRCFTRMFRTCSRICLELSPAAARMASFAPGSADRSASISRATERRNTVPLFTASSRAGMWAGSARARAALRIRPL